MARLIPRKTKVKVQFYKNFTVKDAVIGILFFALIGLVFLTDLTFKIPLAIGLGLLCVIMMINIAPETRLYESIGDWFGYLFAIKEFKRYKEITSKSVEKLMPYSRITVDGTGRDEMGIINYGNYYGAVCEIVPIEFYMLDERRQNSYINAVDNALKILANNQTAMFVKLQRPFVLDKYIKNERGKIDTLNQTFKNGVINRVELVPRREIIEDRLDILEQFNNSNPEDIILKDRYYFVVFSSDIRSLRNTMNMVVNSMEGGTGGSLKCNLLGQMETACFLKNTYTDNFNEREAYDMDPSLYMDWIMPKEIKFGAMRTVVDGQSYTTYEIADYPVAVRNAWGNAFFNMPGTKVVVKFKPVGQSEAEKRIDSAIMEMEIQMAKRAKASVELQRATHLETLQKLMVSIKEGNELLFDTNIYITAKEEVRRDTRLTIRRGGFKYNELFCGQMEAFINANISRRNTDKKFERGINSQSLAAIFPFISDAVQDEKGVFLGFNTEPVFLDVFQRDRERINSNMVIIGKSGSGKSFSVKGLLSHLSADETKIFILDPEKEYDILAHNLGGKVVDVGSAKEGRINPFQVMTTLSDDGEEGQNVALAAHLQFLEQFFDIILDGITRDALEVLNECVKQLYANFGITEKTDIEKLRPDQYPLFQDLYEFINEQYDKATDEYMRSNLRIVKTYINKFAEGGRNSLLWNGYSSITADENMIVFNFQSLLANKNNTIANAQMLLVLRWLDNEIIKNKDYNAKYAANRKVVVVIDEAHVFIDPKKDVALDFMYQLAKRIRKYNGMEIVCTQNIKDFVGTQEIARKSTAIINASQYSFIFNLAPNDLNDLVTLYEKAGEINETEQDTIVSNPRGRAFLITGPYSRTCIGIEYSQTIRDLFEKPRQIDMNTGTYSLIGQTLTTAKEEAKPVAPIMASADLDAPISAQALQEQNNVQPQETFDASSPVSVNVQPQVTETTFEEQTPQSVETTINFEDITAEPAVKSELSQTNQFEAEQEKPNVQPAQPQDVEPEVKIEDASKATSKKTDEKSNADKLKDILKKRQTK